MGKLFCVMGKSASGKDTLFKRLAADESLGLHTVEGAEDHFTNEAGFEAFRAAG